ncbi:MAG TPA: Na+:solute symporter [Ignavibacteriaceae bacterium]|jgi:SSS family solute:Na+ symporter|nr:MAG: Sodium/glucose cotransporter [Ignavibacteria bacterium ADurb.Bin266]OQY70901.1 MAG: sodium:proline symporter [Ignavibacteriales bacterium UTCHB2]HQF41419.1 Na+:solute symporter [Ignavibacteriaceae bacterium]HQI40640.1 Na+:solute symporter [Ignavibacteriaceae bacterium]HQJ45157.1 Na+:solute symporter [Ignavibacteriaceae bacterium]
MEFLDYLIVIAYFIFSIIIALIYYKKAGKSTDDFFLSGRNLPWYLAGLSMVATTFAADTPLAVTELVAKNGISGNWLWWNYAFGGMLTVFFFARLWRRAGIMTEAEFAEIRYSGKPARFLRGFRALYLGLFMNVIIIGWVNKAMISILVGLFGIDESIVLLYVFGAMILVAIYSAISGLWGVVVTDAFQFFIAITGCIILAIIVVNSPQVGGMDGLQEKLPDYVFNFFPTISDVPTAAGTLAMTTFSFLAYIGIIWWASWYPGAEPGGGGYVAQRMMSAKNEKHSLFATLFFQIAHYTIRPWPWIVVGLASLVLYPELADSEKAMGYIYAMRDFLPVGLKGLLVAAFFAAYMSTVATQLNWGTSYIVNDFYKRFLVTDKKESFYVLSSRIVTIILMLISLVVTLFINKISGAWAFIMECGAGVGLVLILRWFWWRINAWSEISAMITPFLVFPILRSFDIEFPLSLFIIVPATTIVWLVVTLLTKPTDDKVLKSFYRKIHPGGVMWKKISSQIPEVENDSGFFKLFINWIIGVILVYSILFGTGKLLLSDYTGFLIYILVAAVSIVILYYNMSKIGWKKIAE